MAADLKKAFDIDATLTAGSNGIFDVIVDGSSKIYSKYDTGRFPESGEVEQLISAL
ncbi:MAG: hypothetical protein D8M59_16860 [Planctomycetes bacterium]|nr:hypothetical protein [Planctomycetota bacterium]NOG52867.1 hypothetical protein [Planctomycetota bacterium]